VVLWEGGVCGWGGGGGGGGGGREGMLAMNGNELILSHDCSELLYKLDEQTGKDSVP